VAEEVGVSRSVSALSRVFAASLPFLGGLWGNIK
jgi:hypothetical protein